MLKKVDLQSVMTSVSYTCRYVEKEGKRLKNTRIDAIRCGNEERPSEIRC